MLRHWPPGGPPSAQLTEATEGLAEPVIMHTPPMLPEQVAAGCGRVAAILADTNPLKEPYAVAAHQPQRLSLELGPGAGRFSQLARQIAPENYCHLRRRSQL
jgi:hypothetical protein